jgi:hypothetical protein
LCGDDKGDSDGEAGGAGGALPLDKKLALLEELGDTYSSSEQPEYPLAVEKYTAFIEAADPSHPRLHEIMNSLALTYIDLDDPPNAIKFYALEFDLLEKLGPSKRAAALNALYGIDWQMQEYVENKRVPAMGVALAAVHVPAGFTTQGGVVTKAKQLARAVLADADAVIDAAEESSDLDADYDAAAGDFKQVLTAKQRAGLTAVLTLRETSSAEAVSDSDGDSDDSDLHQPVARTRLASCCDFLEELVEANAAQADAANEVDDGDDDGGGATERQQKGGDDDTDASLTESDAEAGDREYGGYRGRGGGGGTSKGSDSSASVLKAVKRQKEEKRKRHAKKNDVGETMVHKAAIKGDVEKVRELLEDNAYVNTTDNNGWTPLHEACNHGHEDIVKLLLTIADPKAKVNTIGSNIVSIDKITPLHDAAENSYASICKLLLEHGANPRLKDVRGRIALDVAGDEETFDAIKEGSVKVGITEAATRCGARLRLTFCVLKAAHCDWFRAHLLSQ